MQLIFVLAIVFIQIGFINLLQVMKIVRTFRIHAFMNDEVLAIFLA